MKIEKISDKLIKVVAGQDDYNLDDYYENLVFLESISILTYGDTNYRIFEKFFLKKGYDPKPLDLCLEDDKSIGLEMPETWYLNKGKHALPIATYYNYLNWHGIVETKNIKTFNKRIANDYGRVSCVEVYLEKELTSFLDLHKIDYFGTPRTLTECVRYLEGWSIQKYPRLKGYATFSKFIELWSRINFPHFNADEWYLGKEKSNRINRTSQLTNVRNAVKFFWQNYLLKRNKKISDEDVEVDILGGKFYKIRQPKVVLISEDLFSSENSSCEIFKNLTRKLGKEKMYVSKQKNDFPRKNADIATEIFPDSLIVLIENDGSFSRNFTLANPIKQSINTDVVIATKILRHVLESHK